jgi:hypothetical protein
MNFPEPREGLVVRYSYLWHWEHRAGLEEGIKDRPCAIVLSIVESDGRRRVTVLPVTHTPPSVPENAIEIPMAIKRHLGLDTERSWIVISEVNRFRWPGADLRPIPGHDISTSVYGMLPPGFFARVREAFVTRLARRKVKAVPRTE